MSVLDLSCRCGATRWRLEARKPGALVTCYCNSCQSYQRHLGQAETALNPAGGTLIFQTLPENLTIVAGAEHLAALRMTSKGVVRWYASCCNTAVANTMATPALPFVGLVLPPETRALGRCRNHVFTEAAKTKIRQRGMYRAGWGVILRGLLAKIAGRTASPFFADGALKVTPVTLDRAARQAAGWPG